MPSSKMFYQVEIGKKNYQDPNPYWQVLFEAKHFKINLSL